MIRKIDYIRDFGIFQDFNWVDIDDFKEKNIFYGWNYSGKTTLSRIFSCLRDQLPHESFPAAAFKLTHDLGSVDQSDLGAFPYKVAVYNSEYAKENLRLEFDENINAIYFEIGENAKIATQVQKYQDLILGINGSDTLVGQKKAYLDDLLEFNAFEEQFTIESRRIKNEVFSSLIDFTKANFKGILNRISADFKAVVIASKPELARLAKTVLIAIPKPSLELISFEPAFQSLLDNATLILAQIPSKSKMRGILEKDPQAYQWAKSGLTLHKKKDDCIFCGNRVSDDRYEALLTFFQNESSKLKEAISTLLFQITAEQEQTITLQLPSSVNDFNEGFQEDFLKRETELKKEIVKYQKLLDKLSGLLQDKLDKKIYTKVIHKISAKQNTSLLAKLAAMNEVISRNNQFAERFEETIKVERDRYKDHLVGHFLIEHGYLRKKKKMKMAQEKINTLEDMVKAFEQQIAVLNASKESDAEGCAQFNAFVQGFLSRDDIHIQLNPTSGKFNLIRNRAFAKNLSEGEKMAISFSHFLVHLKSIRSKGLLQDYIIYIDDPISSLDSNHIFQVNSLLKEIFFDKIPDPNQPNHPKQMMWKLQCRQLFISTHNFEFFNLLKELPKADGMGKKKESKYFINRILNESAIQNLPAVYKDFPSEYHFLFGEILQYYNTADKASYPRLLMMPNIMRRFVEMYTLTRYPSNDEVDGRAEEIFGKTKAKRILKLLHYFSHFNSIDRINRHSEFMADIEHACNDLITLIKEEDKLHYRALEAAVT